MAAYGVEFILRYSAVKADKPAIPWTMQVLQSIKPGEKITYYRGNFSSDTAVAGPLYRQLLKDVFAFAQYLEGRGRLRLSQQSHRIASENGLVTINSYVAEGI